MAVISEDAAGSPLSAVVQVQFERHAAQEIGQFRQRVAAIPHVQIYFDLAGSFDVLLIVVAADMDEYNQFAEAMLERSPVRRFETTFVKKRVKASLAVPFNRPIGA